MTKLCLTASSLLSLLLSVIPSLAAAPAVTRVEPPNWWIGHSWNPVRLLIEGRDLFGAKLANADGTSAGPVSVSTNGCWALVEITIGGNAKPGPQALQLTTPGGKVALPFELLPKLPAAGRFQGFSPDDVLYLLMPDRFANGDTANDQPTPSPGLLDRAKPRHYHGGDLAGVTQRLAYLTNLGVTALWLTPWYDNANHLNQLEKYTADNQRASSGVPSTDYHGYGATDFYAVEERLGDLPALRGLVEAAHRNGLKIVQDQVANHTGPYHRWTTNTPTPTWYNGTVASHLENKWETWTIADPSAPEEKRKQTIEGWFINLLPDLNQNDPQASAYLIQNSLWWLGQTGLDALRQDTLPYVPRSHWARWTAAVKREHPQVTILGEMWDGNPKLVSFFQGGRKAFDGVDTGVDTLFDFPLFYALRDVFAKRQPMTRLTDTLAADTNYVNPRVLVTFLGLHDTPRFLSEPGADLAGLKLAFTFLLTARGTPLIYYGDEVAMRGGNDPHNRADFPGGFPGDAQNAFEASSRTPEQAEVFNHVQQVLQLRRELEPLRRGEMRLLLVDREVLIYARETTSGTTVVALNNSREQFILDLEVASLGLTNGARLHHRLGQRGEVLVNDQRAHMVLLPRESAVLSTQ
jgi:glycosidase